MMLEALQDCIGTNVAIQTGKGTSFDGYLRKISKGCIYVDVKSEDGSPKGTFILNASDVFLLVKVTGVALARNLKIQ